MSLLQVDDIQGIVLYGYGRLQHAAFLLLAIGNPPAARTWLRTLGVRNAQFDPAITDRCTNIAFTRAGLERLGLPADVMSGFSTEFTEGMTGTEHRRRTLGDVGESSPERWSWGGPGNPEPHVLLMLYARDAAILDALVDEHQRSTAAAGFQQVRLLDTNWLAEEREHFGFRDGVSRVVIEGSGSVGPAVSTIAAGEFVLGYPNAYGQYSERPLVSSAQDPGGLLSASPDDGDRRDLGMNGSYLVFRQLSQDVYGFWRFIHEQTMGPDGLRDPEGRIRLASKMVGRWPSGAPLVKSPEADDPRLAADDDFVYCGLDDRQGFKCPIGSHIRRSNPRDALEPEPGSARSIEIGKRHRILRRGRNYGAPAAAALGVDDILAGGGGSGERGLHFICLNAHIGRQFEFIQHTWVNNPKFDGLYEDDDPLVGHRGGGRGEPGGTFTVQAEPIRRRVTGMPRFVQVRGGGYFFMPGLRAIRYLAHLH